MMRIMGEHEGRALALHVRNRRALEARRKALRAAVAKVLAVGLQDGHVRSDLPLEVQAHFLMSLLRGRNPLFAGGLARRPKLPR